MKRPITILCISDLHIQEHGMIEEGMANADILSLNCLRHSLLHFQGECTERIKWNPDFLLIAGDLVDRCTQTNYNYVKEQIDALIDLFKIEPFRVILTPGNHDRQVFSSQENCCRTKALKKKYEKTEEHFSQFCKVETISDDLKKQFVKEHVNAFRQFTDLYKLYCEPRSSLEKFEYWRGLFENLPCRMHDLKYTSGLKIFENEKVCFLSVNTEWLYTRNSIKPSGEQKIRPCSPFIKWAFNEIQKSYPDYTVVTIMHRNPRSLSWETQNITDPLQIDSVSLLETYSDIILSGHDHTIKITPPTMLQNHAQHLGIGSISRPEGINENVRYTATLLHINPIMGEMQLMAYDRWASHIPWHFIDLGTFPLQTKYQLSECVKNSNDDMFIIKIRAKSSDDFDIESAIKSYLQWNEKDETQFGLLFINYYKFELSNIEEIKQKIQKLLEQYKRVFFYRWQSAPTPQMNFKKEQTQEDNPLEVLKKHLRYNLLNQSLIIADIMVDIPILSLNKEMLFR